MVDAGVEEDVVQEELVEGRDRDRRPDGDVVGEEAARRVRRVRRVVLHERAHDVAPEVLARRRPDEVAARIGDGWIKDLDELKKLIPLADEGYSALIEDLEARGLLGQGL